MPTLGYAPAAPIAGERWRNIPPEFFGGHCMHRETPEGRVCAQVSNKGRVRSVYGLVTFGRRDRKDGYLYTIINGREFSVDRLVLAAFKPHQIIAACRRYEKQMAARELSESE